ncbi:hypothetical protein EPI10_015595 [Gossypium australe]|uniref:Uncharacterized protein n=1 Tax=Gossypium australe TaxID=47621 RepID=A0A5B6VL83_9ROSI|nr:hypothetical protein EPI10_015595 [Gossypium australe]
MYLALRVRDAWVSDIILNGSTVFIEACSDLGIVGDLIALLSYHFDQEKRNKDLDPGEDKLRLRIGTQCAKYRVFDSISKSEFKASLDSGIVRDIVTLSNRHFGTFELMVYANLGGKLAW